MTFPAINLYLYWKTAALDQSREPDAIFQAADSTPSRRPPQAAVAWLWVTVTENNPQTQIPNTSIELYVCIYVDIYIYIYIYR